MTRAQYFGARFRSDEGERRARGRSRARMRVRFARRATDRSERARLSSPRRHRRGDRRRVVRRVDPHRALADRARTRGGGAFARRPSPATFARLTRVPDETRRDETRSPTDRSTDLARARPPRPRRTSSPPSPCAPSPSSRAPSSSFPRAPPRPRRSPETSRARAPTSSPPASSPPKTSTAPMMRRTSRVTVAMMVIFPRSRRRPMCTSTRHASSSAETLCAVIHPAHPSSDSRVCAERPRTVGMAPSVWGALLKTSMIHDSRLPTPWYGKSGFLYENFGFLTTQRGDQSRGPRRRRTRAREREDDA